MESANDLKNLVSQSKNICVIPSKEPESLPSALALFYTLRESGKNVNVIVDSIPEKLNFLVPSPDFISTPKNFVFSIPKDVAEISQIYYEKNDQAVKIHLTLDRGRITKDNVAFYVENAKPDLVITVGIKDFQKDLAGQLDGFGFLLGVAIVNIDADDNGQPEKLNTKFGQVNIIENASLAQAALKAIMAIIGDAISKNTANCLLTGLLMHYENFTSLSTGPEALETAASLIKHGAEYPLAVSQLQKTTEPEDRFIAALFQNIKQEGPAFAALLDSGEFQDFGEYEAGIAVQKIKQIGMNDGMLALWQSHNSPAAIKGFFYSRKPQAINKIAGQQNIVSSIKNEWVFLIMPGENLAAAKDSLLKLLN